MVQILGAVIFFAVSIMTAPAAFGLPVGEVSFLLLFCL